MSGPGGAEQLFKDRIGVTVSWSEGWTDRMTSLFLPLYVPPPPAVVHEPYGFTTEWIELCINTLCITFRAWSRLNPWFSDSVSVCTASHTLESVRTQWLKITIIITIVTLHHINWGAFYILFINSATGLLLILVLFLDASRKLCAQLACLQTCLHFSETVGDFHLDTSFSYISPTCGDEREKSDSDVLCSYWLM